jgi:hypothetical protein
LNFTTDALKMSGISPKIAYQLRVDLAVHLVCKKKKEILGEKDRRL